MAVLDLCLRIKKPEKTPGPLPNVRIVYDKRPIKNATLKSLAIPITLILFKIMASLLKFSCIARLEKILWDLLLEFLFGSEII